MKYKNIIGVDIGGTNIRAGLVSNDSIDAIVTAHVNAEATAEQVVKQLFSIIDKVMHSTVDAIGIGVPGLVNAKEEMVYDVINIPAWQQIALQKIVQDKYGIPVLLENDANCFALGEFYFGKGKDVDSMIGLTIGTGLGSGIIINKKLYTGRNGGAGEFGMMEYLDRNYEYYASGQFFENVYHEDGEAVFLQAYNGSNDALKKYSEMGTHLGNAIKAMLYATDVEMIVLGGSVCSAYNYFKNAMLHQLKTIAFKKAFENIRIEVSQLGNAGIMGAAALHFV